MSTSENDQWARDHERAWSLIEQEDYQGAIRLYSTLADAGSFVAQDVLGWMHLTGRGTPEDHRSARVWFEKAAESEYAWGEYHLGYVALIEQRFDSARMWFERASQRGHDTATYRLGLLYLHGQGVQPDEDRACSLFRAAAENGHVLARRDMLRVMARRAPSLVRRLWCRVLIILNFFRAVRIIARNPRDERLDLS